MIDDNEAEDPTPEDQKAGDADVIATALKRFKQAEEAEIEMRIEQLDDIRFRAGEQWDPKVKQDRLRKGRPCITINRVPSHLRAVTNDQRQNRPSIKVNPVDDIADPDTAKILQGMVRHIESQSNADNAYDRAFEGGAGIGLGYWRVITQYCDEMSFDQEIRIKSIRDRFSVYFDPTYQEPDGSDANWAIIFDDISPEDFKAQWPNSKLTGLDSWSGVGDSAKGWVGDKTVRIAEYFFKTFKPTKIFLLSDGQVVEESQLEQTLQMTPGLRTVRNRETVLPAIKWVKMNAIEVLEQTDWLGRWIPVVPVLGEEIIIEGKRILEGIIRHAKDPQRMYNFWSSAATEVIGLSTKSPWIGYKGQFEGNEKKWESANTENHAFLEVNPVTINGTPAPLPQRNSFEPPIQAINVSMANAAEDLKATTGVYDASLGNRSNENSGVAIQRRNQQSQTANFHYVDNLSRSMKHTGRIIVELIPKIYDTARAQRILGEEGEEEIVKINQEFEKNGEKKTYQLDRGRYDVSMSTGPSYATKRQEAVVSMMEFIRVYPQAAAVVGDLFAKNMDWPGATEIAERLRKMLPPELQEPKDGEKQPLPPEAQQQLQQMDQMIQQLTKALEDANEKTKSKTLELESKERIELAKLQTQIELELFKSGSKEGLEMLKLEHSQIEARMNMLGQNEPIENELENGAGSEGAVALDPNQQSTGGLPPGTSME